MSRRRRALGCGGADDSVGDECVDALSGAERQTSSHTFRLNTTQRVPRGHSSVFRPGAERQTSIGADVLKRFKMGRTALHLAAEGNRTEMVRGLLASAIDVNSDTALHLTSSAALAKVLIARGNDVNARNKGGDTALHVNCCRRNDQMIRVLIDGGADVNVRNHELNTPLGIVVTQREVTRVKMLLCAGADVNSLNKLHQTPLHCAIRSGNDEIVRLLIKLGSDVRACDNDQRTPLHMASGCCMPDVVEMMVGAGADVNTRDKQMCTPLHYAARSLRDKTTVVLLDAGSDVHARDEKGRNPFLLGTMCFCNMPNNAPERLMNALLLAGSDLYCGENKTALQIFACRWNGGGMTRKVLCHGAFICRRSVSISWGIYE